MFFSFFISFCSSFVELKATILGPPDLYVKSTSEIILTCKISQGPHDLGTVFWYKGKFLTLSLCVIHLPLIEFRFE